MPTEITAVHPVLGTRDVTGSIDFDTSPRRFSMRTSILFLTCVSVGLFALPLSAAPVPADKEAKRKELDGLWAELYKAEPAATHAVLKLFKQPDHAVPFLKAKLQPLKLDADRCRQLIKELGSDDEMTWKAAREELDYLDPRLAVDLQTLMTDVTEKPARTRLVELLSDHHADSLAGREVKLEALGNDGFNFTSNIGVWWAEHKVERIGGFWGDPKRAWRRAGRGVAILEQIGTPEAVKVLEQVAAGHPDASPTKAAKESLARLKK